MPGVILQQVPHKTFDGPIFLDRAEVKQIFDVTGKICNDAKIDGKGSENRIRFVIMGLQEDENFAIFAEMKNGQKIKYKNPTDFFKDWDDGAVVCDLRIVIRTTASNQIEWHFKVKHRSISIRCIEYDELTYNGFREIVDWLELRNWNPVRNFWAKNNWITWILGIILIFSFLDEIDKKDAVNQTKIDVWALAHDGVSDKNRDEVIKGIAQIVSDNSKYNEVIRKNEKKYWVYMAVTAFILLISSFIPRIEFQLGGNKLKYKLFYWHEKIFIVFVPGYLMSTFFVPGVNEWIASFIK